MPRPKVINRKRAVKACSLCKRRKEKCDGAQPCGRCKHRGREKECTFLDIDPNISTLNASITPPQSHSDTFDAVGTTTISEHRQDISSYYASNGDNSVSNAATSAPVPELSRFLQDPKGKFSKSPSGKISFCLTTAPVYIGDSASLSFLQTVRRIVESSIGENYFTTDELRHHIIETSPHIQDSDIAFGLYLPDLNEALDLIREYAVTVSGALDLFDVTYISDDIHAWLEDPMRSSWPNCCIFELVLALGAQARARDHLDDCFAEQRFVQGRNHATKYLVDDPSLITVQAFSLITWYMLSACRRNGATMNLGFAVQAAYALGLHRHEANISFGAQTAKSRERAWKTLRVCDLFLSASMGRPSITSRIDANVLSGTSYPIDANDRLASAMTRICLIFERIISEVYAHRAVSLELATSISEQHRSWTEALPEMLEADGLSPDEVAGPVDLSKTLGCANVVMAYHYSIILLTRPFLTFGINSYIKKKGRWPDKPGAGPSITTYADACVTSAINGIAMARNVLRYDKMPKRLPLIVNSVFISALVIGLAYFGDYHCRGWALDQSIEQAIHVLQHFGLKSPQPARYQQIVEFLRSATMQYKDHHQEIKMRNYNQQVSSVFGNVSAQLDRGRLSTVRPNTKRQTEASGSTGASSIIDSETASSDPFSSIYGNLEAISRTSLITTSGKLAPTHSEQDNLQFPQTSAGDDGLRNFMDDMLEHTASGFSSMEEGPLFALMQDYYPG